MSLRSGLIGAVAWIGLLLSAAPAEAQQVCYAYDTAGRLSGVIDQHNNAALYEYDAVGNITAIRRKTPTGPVTIYSVDAVSGSAGHRIEIFGIGFSSIPAQNQVTIGDVPVPVVSVVPCTLTVEVPSGAVSGALRVVTPSGEGTAESGFTVLSFDIEGTGLAILRSATMQFTVTTNGCANQAVTWSVNGVPGGSSAVGTISPAGLYTAPAVIPTPSAVTIRAESVACPSLAAERILAIVAEFSAFAFDAASAAYGTPPVKLPANVVMHSASARYGTPPEAYPAGAILDAASAANVPVITSVSPATRARGTTFTISIAGSNLSGATGLTFLGTVTPDTSITVSDLTVNGTGTLLTATVTIAATTVVGTRIIRVDAAAGNSTAQSTGVNVLTITQ